MPTVTITPMLPSVEEGKDATFTVTLSGQAEADIVVTLTPSPGSGSGAAEVGDYVTGSVSVTFKTGDRVKTLRLQTRDDEVYEGNEEVALDFSISGPATKTSVPSRLTITEDDPRPTVTITSPSVEEGGRAIFTVNLDRSLEATVTIELSVNEGTAGSEDYAVSHSETLLSVTLGAGVRAGTLSLQTVEDDVYEGDETVLLSFSATSGGENVMGLPISRTLTITDAGDLPQASFVTPSSSTIDEGNTVAIKFVLDVESYTDTVVVLTVRSTSAVDGLDYRVVERSVTIAAGTTSGVIMFEAVADGRYDGGVSETVELRLPGGDLHRVAITDVQIQPTISLEVPDVVFEGDRAYNLTATLSGPVAFDVTVFLDAGPDSTALFPDDYFLPGAGVEIKAGELTATFLFAAYSDSVREGDELLELVPRVSIGGMDVIGLTQTITIINVGAGLPVLSITTDSSEVPEPPEPVGESRHEINVELDTPLTGDLKVFIRVVSSSTAKEGEDFELSNPEGLVIRAGETNIEDGDAFDVRILSDSIYEGDEYIVLELTTDNPNVRTPDRITITIEDKLPTASLDPFDPTILEGNDLEITARLDVAAAVTVTVELGLGVGSSAVESDYDLSPLSAQIAAGDLTATFRLTALEDTLYEFSETLVLQPVTSYGADELAGVAGTVVILENDPPLTVVLDPSGTISITEGTGPYEITVRLNRVQGVTTAVELIELAASTAKPSADYELSTSSVQIAAGALTATFTITAKSDGIYEGLDTETLRLMLRVIVDGANVAVGSREILIVDDDPAPSISFVSESSTIAEDAANPRHEIELTLNGALVDEDITVTFMITGSATNSGINADYTLTSTMVTIKAGTSTAIIRLDVNDDELYEGLESETVVLSLVSATGGVAVAATKSESEHRVTIEDDDSAPSISFVSAFSTIEEDAADSRHDIELTLNGALTDEDITVAFMITGSATRGADYTLAATVVTIPAGTSTAIIRLDVNDDGLYEGLESETVVLSLVSATGGVAVDATKSEHRVTIEDDDSAPSISFVSASSTIAEDAANPRHEIELTLNGALVDEDITVAFIITGSATRGINADYTLTTTTVTIKAGTSVAIIRLDVNDDGLYEILESETVVLSLVSATGGIAVDATSSEHRVTITDNDPMPTVTITPASTSVEEGEDVTFTVTLNGQAEADIVVTLTPSPGSGPGAAEAGDYFTGSVSVTFSSTGDGVKTLRLRTTEDEVYEGDEEVALDFSISGPATRASVPSTLTIEDDDPAPSISFALASSTIAEDAADSRHEIELTLNGALAEDDITVAFMITGSATRGIINADYTLTATVVTIPAGTSTAIIRLDVNDDGLYEGLESETVVLSLVSATGGVAVDATRSEHTVTITDNDPIPTVTITPASPLVEEGEYVTFTVTLNGRAEADIVVTLTPSPGSGSGAAEAADYFTGSVSVTFSSTGDGVKTLVLGTREDEVYEGDEEVALDFSISGPATQANAPSTLTIEDDDPAPSISFASASSTIAEDAANPRHEIELTLNGLLTAEDITVTFILAGSATKNGINADYTLTATVVTIRLGPVPRLSVWT